MPFTPFHMGPALLLKSLTGRRFSVLVFGVSQVGIDIEPLVRMIRSDSILHGFTHTLSGALLVGAGAGIIGRPLANWFLRILRQASREASTSPLLRHDVTWSVALTSAWVGTGSHLLLDGIMHADMSPFAPVMNANPLLGVVGWGSLHLFCVATGIAGLAILLVSGAWAARRASSRPA